jgi:hypothetical protein
MKSVQRFGVKRKLAPRYVGPFQIIGKSGAVAYKIQLPPKMSAIFNVFHVSQLKKCLQVPKERVLLGDIELESDLMYEEKLVHVIDTRERVTRSQVVKWCGVIKVVRVMLLGKEKIIYERVVRNSINIGMLSKSQDEIFIRGEGCNILGVWLP